MPRGGPRPNSGGKRPGAGRKKGKKGPQSPATAKAREVSDRFATDGGITILEVMGEHVRRRHAAGRKAEAEALKAEAEGKTSEANAKQAEADGHYNDAFAASVSCANYFVPKKSAVEVSGPDGAQPPSLIGEVNELLRLVDKQKHGETNGVPVD